MARVFLVCIVLLVTTLQAVAQGQRSEPDPKVLIQLGYIYGHATDDAEFAALVQVLASECGRDADDSRRLQFAYDAIEVAKLMEPKSVYVTLLAFARSLPREQAREFRTVIRFELARLALEEYRSAFRVDRLALGRLRGANLAKPASDIDAIQTGVSPSGLQFNVSCFGMLARAALDSCSDEQDRFDTYWGFKEIGSFAPKGGFCYHCYVVNEPWGIFRSVIDRPFDEVDINLPKGGKGRYNAQALNEHQDRFENDAVVQQALAGHELAIQDLERRLSKLEARVDVLATTVAQHEQRIRRCEERDERFEQLLGEQEERLRQLGVSVNQLEHRKHGGRGFFRRVGGAISGAAKGLAGVVSKQAKAGANVTVHGVKDAVRGLGDLTNDAVCGVASLFPEDSVVHLVELPESADEEAKRCAVVFDFDTDSAYPSPAISKTGEVSGGLKATGDITGGCRDPIQLERSNTYHRMASIRKGDVTFAVHMYALYFLKDQWAPVNPLGFVGQAGHRHDWEYTLVWTRNGQVTHASCSAHGDLSTKPSTDTPVKMVYHKDGLATHSFRYADPGEQPENHRKQWITPTLVDWYTMKGDGVSNEQLRRSLNEHSFGEANCPVNDSNYGKEVAKNPPPGYPPSAEWQATAKVR